MDTGIVIDYADNVFFAVTRVLYPEYGD